MIAEYLKVFFAGAALCMIGQVLIDKTRLTPARILTLYVVAGVLLGAVGVYAPFVRWAGAGASVPLTGFGNLLAGGVRKAERDDIQVVYCDANGIAESVGNPKGANVAILGALMEKAPVVSNEILGEAIRIELGEKKAKFLEGNMKALEAGEAAARG